ncbi:MAG: glycerophosphodiester phosphodiesterase [Acidimicrobiales bacterium]
MNEAWLERRVVAFAHQGGSFEAPSSTLAAIEHALDHGAIAIELDVHATKDRQIVVCHDDTVDRTTHHHGAIAQLTLSQLREMDNAYWWVEGSAVRPGLEDDQYVHRGKAPDDERYAIVTLEQVAENFPTVLLNLDIKQTEPEVEGYEELLANEVRRLERTGSVIVASFHDAAIQKFRSLAPEVATSAATGETAAFYFSMLEGSPLVVPPVCAFQVPATYGELTVVNEQFVESAHRSGVAVHVWTINEVDEMRRLLDVGVDGIISDTPTVLEELLTLRGCKWDGVL